MTETRFIGSVHKKLDPEVLRWKIHDRYSTGRPDCYYAGTKGVALWVEYKFVPELPARLDTVLRYRKDLAQFEFMSKLVKCKQNAVLAIGSGQRVLVLGNDQWPNDITKRQFQNDSIPLKEFVSWIEMMCMEK